MTKSDQGTVELFRALSIPVVALNLHKNPDHNEGRLQRDISLLLPLPFLSHIALLDSFDCMMTIENEELACGGHIHRNGVQEGDCLELLCVERLNPLLYDRVTINEASE
jgi:hypothetical protein